MEELGIESRWGEWKKSEEGRNAFLAALAKILYSDPGRFGFDTVDQAADSLAWHRERILSLLDRYVDKGSSFESYVSSSLRYLAKSYRRDERRLRERDMACERSLRFADPEQYDWESESDSVLFEPIIDRAPVSSSRRHRKARDSRILYLLIKCAWEAGDRETRLAAEITGLPETQLSLALAQARRFLEIERCRFERMTARRNRAWSAIRIYEARLAEETGELQREGLLGALARSRKEYECALADLRSFRPLVPNSVVARLLKVPKGSVDSGIHYLKKQDRTCSPEAEQARLPPWNSSSRQATHTNSSNSAPSSPAIDSCARPMWGIRPLMSRKMALPMSKTP